jgi:tetratricopeptide (TPR) repeat protein
LEQSGDHAEAAVSYARALALQPNSTESRQGLWRARSASNKKAARSEAIRQRFDAGMDAFSRGDLVLARDAFATILEVDTEDADASQMYHRTLRAIDSRKTDLARQCARAIEAGQADEARALIEQIKELDPTSSAALDLAQRLDRASSDRVSRARALSVRPSTSTTDRRRQVSQEDRDEAERLFQQGVRAMGSGRSAEGLRYFELAATLNPEHERASEYLKREYLQRGIVAFSSGDLEHAVELWEKVLAIDPTDEKASGYLKRAREQMTRARQILDKK